MTHTGPVISLRAAIGRRSYRALEAGCADDFTKPFDHREVLARVRAHLQQHLFGRLAEQAEPSRQAQATLAGAKSVLYCKRHGS